MKRDAAATIAAAADLARRSALLEQAGHRAEASLLRRIETRTDPALFALTYLAKHLTDPATGRVSLSPVHVAWAKRARRWAKPLGEPAADRRAEVAPREMGKSTWHFLLLPMWAAAHGHRRFAAAFADTDTQAQTHLATFRRELDTNALLQADYPDLCAPRTKGRGTVEADRVSLYHAKSGFVFAAAGMDSSNLGMKVGDARPDLLILDDIEPHEGRYSADLAKKRLGTLRQAIFPLNVRASVILVGTVTMHGSIVHQAVQHARGVKEPELAWVAEERIVVNHARPFRERRDGSRSSVWPEKWSTEYLESIEHTRGFLLNYENDPLGADGDYWTVDDFVRKADPAARLVLLSIDPAVTSKGKSDYTGLAVVACNRAEGRVVVRHAEARKLTPAKLKERVLQLVSEHGVGVILIETNQGGDLWQSILGDVPATIRVVHQTVAKETRAASALNHYQRGHVWHDPAANLDAAEGQMVAFPRGPNDDLVDTIGSGVAYFLDRKRRTKVGGASIPYV